MKKNLTLLTGIVILFAIMIAGGCNDINTLQILDEDPSITVVLNAAVQRKDMRKHLEMYNSYDSDSLVVDTLVTVVSPGDTIIWDKKSSSGIKEILHVRPMENIGNIFPEPAKEVSYNKKKVFMHIVPKNATKGEVKYEIVFEDEDKNTWCIDPHLRIPPARVTNDDTGDR